MLLGVKKYDPVDFRKSRFAKQVLDSGNYRHGFTVTERAKVPAGTYAMIVSTFNEGQLGVFNIKIAMSAAIEVREID